MHCQHVIELPLFIWYFLFFKKKIYLLFAQIMIMRSSYIISLCIILPTALCLLLCKTSNSPVPVSLLGRRAVRDLSMLPSGQQDAHHKIKVHEEMERDSNQPGSFANVYNEPELVYHIDYHGVTTHPNPTPKHPKP